MNEYVEKSKLFEQIDQWIYSGECCYSNATYYLKKRISEIAFTAGFDLSEQKPIKKGNEDE